MEWSNEKVILFLEILQTEPCLWDPRHKSYKNRSLQNDAWQRILQLLPFTTTVNKIKNKKETLMGYYRTHLNKYKKSLKSGAGKNDIYTTNWFAYETMDSFLRVVYDSNRTLNTVVNEDRETQIKTDEEDDGNENSLYLSSEIKGASQNMLRDNMIPRREYKSSQDFSLKLNSGKRQPRDDLPPEIRVARPQMDEAFEYIKDKKDDEYEIFGRLIASKLKKMNNPNTRDVLMNDIHNLVFRTCMADRLEQQSEASAFSNRTNPGPSNSE